MAALTVVRPMGDLTHLPSPTDRAGRRTLRRTLDERWCRRGHACLVGEPVPGSRLLVVEGAGADPRFVDHVVAAVQEWDLEPVVLGTPDRRGRGRVDRDVLDESGAAALARSLGRRLGTRPEWDVRPATDLVAAVTAHARAVGAGLVAVAHGPHGSRRACRLPSLAARLPVPVLLV